MQFSHPLMHNNFTKEDMNAAIKLFKHKSKILTQFKYVRLFEKKWAKWLGVKYSTFVNSGSSANLITLHLLKELKKIGSGADVVSLGELLKAIRAGIKKGQLKDEANAHMLLGQVRRM